MLRDILNSRELIHELNQIIADEVTTNLDRYARWNEWKRCWEPELSELGKMRERVRDRILEWLEDVVDEYLDDMAAADAIIDTYYTHLPDGVERSVFWRWARDEVRGDLEFHRLRDEGLL